MQRYDYGSKKKNMRAYGNETPPYYYMENITHKELYFFGGNTDLLVTPKNVDLMLSHLKCKYLIAMICNSYCLVIAGS